MYNDISWLLKQNKQIIQSDFTKGCRRQGQNGSLGIQFTLTEINTTGIDSTQTQYCTMENILTKTGIYKEFMFYTQKLACLKVFSTAVLFLALYNPHFFSHFLTLNFKSSI